MDLPWAFFERTAERVFTPLAMAASAWSPDMVNGPALCGLLAECLDREYGAPEFVPARLTVDLFRPTLRKPVELTTSAARTGRRIVVADAELRQEGQVVARASAVFLRRSEQPPGALWTRAEQPAPPPAALRAGPATHIWGSDAHPAGWSPELGEHQNDSRKRCWQEPVPVLLDEPAGPFAAAAIIGESTSLMTNWGSEGVGFINGDLTLALARLPRGTSIGVEADNHIAVDGVSVGTATLFDADGVFGSCIVTAVANPAAQVDFSRDNEAVDARRKAAAERRGA
ncbi:acyl-CoA thioesterase domain-containing protein [Nocardia sp. NPDC050697]|uniref:acyl-CoA thioesterase domain-containing protein n=1 Tax=Nocardia sp. NPDC050697 TaxID=3155158 RepID=UPI003400BD7C